MESNPPTIRNVTRWIGDMRSVGIRPLDEPTIARLRAYFDRIRRKRFVCWALAALGLLGMCTAIGIFYNAPDNQEPDWLLPLSLVSAVVMGVALLYQKRFGEWLMNGKKQLLYESIEVFENQEGKSIEILLLSQEIVSIDGVPQSGLGYARVEVTADAPSAAIDHNFPSQLGIAKSFGICRQRALTEEEIWELRTYRRMEITPGLRQVTPLVTFFALGPLLVGVFDSDPAFLWIGLAMCFFAGVAWWKVGKEVARSRQIGMDLQGGTVVQIDPSQDIRLAAPIEVLPNSQLVWRQGDDPAAWRRVA